MTSLPVVFVHGLGSTYEANWERSGWADLMLAEGRIPVGHTMAGHSRAGHGPMPQLAPPHDTGTARLHRQIEELGGKADVVGFSAGAVLSLTAAVQRPELFHRLALLGTGDASYLGTIEDKRASLSGGGNQRLLDGVRLAAERAGNDVEEVMASAYSTDPTPSFAQMAAVTCPVLFVLGENDFVGSAERAIAAVPDSRLVTLRDTDHFSTTHRFEAQEAVLTFLSE